jgi:hypothetical protein
MIWRRRHRFLDFADPYCTVTTRSSRNCVEGKVIT